MLVLDHGYTVRALDDLTEHQAEYVARLIGEALGVQTEIPTQRQSGAGEQSATP